jgi:hypothetical protein
VGIKKIGKRMEGKVEDEVFREFPRGKARALEREKYVQIPPLHLQLFHK